MYQRWWLPGLALALASALFLAMSLSVRAQPPPPTSTSRSIDLEALEPHMTTGTCKDGTQASGAVYRICMPSGANPPWNGDLVVYAHGYVPFYEEVGIPEDQMSLPGALFSVDEIVNGMGYAFAATSYYTNGLAVRPAISDLLDLVDIFTDKHGAPGKVLLTGVSEGGLITTLAVEKYPDVFDGGLAMCGPYGSFNRQVSHYGDFRVIFEAIVDDAFEEDLMPGEPISIPTSLIEQWETSYYSETILPVITDPANAPLIDQLLQVTGAAPYAFDPPTSTTSMERLLWYNVYATMDARSKLGGQPFSNVNRTYTGSEDDAALNASVWRIAADPAVLEEIDRYYDPTGVLTSPLVTLHTTGDFLVPYDHVALYRFKVMRADNLAMNKNFKVERYGHCSFELQEILQAFNTLVDMVDTPPTYQPVYKTYLPLVLRTP